MILPQFARFPAILFSKKGIKSIPRPQQDQQLPKRHKVPLKLLRPRIMQHSPASEDEEEEESDRTTLFREEGARQEQQPGKEP